MVAAAGAVGVQETGAAAVAAVVRHVEVGGSERRNVMK